MEHIIYKIKTMTGLFYIGYTCEKDKRFKRHIRDLKNGNHHNRSLQEVFSAEGIDSLTFEILEIYSNEIDARIREEILIKEGFSNNFNKILNQSMYSSGGDLLTNHPEKESIVKKRSVSLKLKVSKLSKEERSEKYGKSGPLNGMYGKKHSEETKEKLSKVNLGNSYNLGKKRSEETKAKMSEIAKQRTGEKNPFFGKTHSEDTRLLIAEANKGRVPLNRRKVSCLGIEYLSLTEAAKSLQISSCLLHYRLNSEKYLDYFYI